MNYMGNAVIATIMALIVVIIVPTPFLEFYYRATSRQESPRPEDSTLPYAQRMAPAERRAPTARARCRSLNDEFLVGSLRQVDARQNAAVAPGVRVSGLKLLPLRPAPDELVASVLGSGCDSQGQQVWAMRLGEHESLLYGPRLFDLPGGRSVLIAPALIPHNGLFNGAYAAAILDASGRPTGPITLMPARPALGLPVQPGILLAPEHQPDGAFHVWHQGGGDFLHERATGVVLRDFSGNAPRTIGFFNDERVLTGSTGNNCLLWRLAAAEYLSGTKLRLTWRLGVAETRGFARAIFYLGEEELSQSGRRLSYELDQGQTPSCSDLPTDAGAFDWQAALAPPSGAASSLAHG